MKRLIAFFILMHFAAVFGQQQPVLNKSVTDYTVQFQQDMENNNLKLYTLGGLIPSNQEIDVPFQKKFHVTYHDFGCLAPLNMDYYNHYNLLVFRHLKSIWGTKWEKDIRDNTMGIYNWKKAKN